ncbi:MAG: hypothetical protein IT535_05275 [Bauldia sp.]|nr:hypothetical protein [Bauldia sp.]
MATFEDHLAWTEPNTRPILLELRKRILEVSPRIIENITKSQRITYSLARIFAEIKVQKKRVLVRFFDAGLADPEGIVVPIPGTHGWQHDKEVRIERLNQVEYAMRFIEASFRSLLAARVDDSFGRG